MGVAGAETNSGTVPSMPSGTRPQVAYGSGPGAAPLGPSSGGRRFESSTEDYQFSVADNPEDIESVVEQLQARKRILEHRREARISAAPIDRSLRTEEKTA